MKVSSYLLVAPFVAFLMCCGNPSEEAQMEVETTIDSTAYYGKADFRLPTLTGTAREQVSQWPVFEDFTEDAQNVNFSTLPNLRLTSERLLEHADSISKNIPDTLQTRLIISRLRVVRTRASLLHQQMHKQRIDSVELQRAIAEMNDASESFIVQINEKFQKESIDKQRAEDERKEMEKQRRFRDSVFQLEIQQKNDTIL